MIIYYLLISLVVGSNLPMPPELMELYSLYQQELNTRQTEQEVNYLSELNTMLRVGIKIYRNQKVLLIFSVTLNVILERS